MCCGGFFINATPTEDDTAAKDRVFALLVSRGEAGDAGQKVRGIGLDHLHGDQEASRETCMIVETRHRLKEWGGWARGGESILTSMFNVLFGVGGTDSDLMPAHIREIDEIVCQAELYHRGALIQFYTKSGSLRDKALVLGVPTATLKYRVEQGEWYVNSVLDGPVQNSIQRHENAVFTPLRIQSVRYFS